MDMKTSALKKSLVYTVCTASRVTKFYFFKKISWWFSSSNVQRFGVAVARCSYIHELAYRIRT